MAKCKKKINIRSLTIAEAAGVLGVDATTAKGYIAAGMPAGGSKRAPRIDLVAAAAWMNRQMAAGK